MRLIDADYLKQALSSNCKPEICPDYQNAWCETCCPHNDFENIIDDVPTVKERPQGEWIKHEDGYNICPFCKNKTAFSYLFCPYCGADMKGGTERWNRGITVY